MKGRTTFVAVLLLVGAAAWADTYISDTWRKVVNDLILDGVGLRIEEGTGSNYKKLVAPGGGFTADTTCILEDDASFIPDSCVGDGVDGGGGGAGEANTASNLGGGLANWDSKVGVDLRFNSFAAADFNLAANVISIDTTTWATDAEVAAGYQPLDADLTALAGLAGVQGDVIYRNATQWTRLAAGTAGQVLHTNGAGANPTWDTDDTGGGGGGGAGYAEIVAAQLAGY